ncbi:hypothetical protein Taro_048857 [Colocasia esculenta]|uniref:Uncharacterized protein n=1 Tax=Colocasia esculenta TaxID=4460 RepID=A0A843X9B3_COLES|nr:hypothetical protein [Colocasia esculenta]
MEKSRRQIPTVAALKTEPEEDPLRICNGNGAGGTGTTRAGTTAEPGLGTETKRRGRGRGQSPLPNGEDEDRANPTKIPKSLEREAPSPSEDFRLVSSPHIPPNYFPFPIGANRPFVPKPFLLSSYASSLAIAVVFLSGCSSLRVLAHCRRHFDLRLLVAWNPSDRFRSSRSSWRSSTLLGVSIGWTDLKSNG